MTCSQPDYRVVATGYYNPTHVTSHSRRLTSTVACSPNNSSTYWYCTCARALLARSPRRAACHLCFSVHHAPIHDSRKHRATSTIPNDARPSKLSVLSCGRTSHVTALHQTLRAQANPSPRVLPSLPVGPGPAGRRGQAVRGVSIPHPRRQHPATPRPRPPPPLPPSPRGPNSHT